MILSETERRCWPERRFSWWGSNSFPVTNRVAFTLIELLVATAVFSLLVLVLASISNQALSVWSRNEQKSDLREAARTAMNLIGSELRQAALPVYRADTNGLQLVVNPPGVSGAFNNHDSIFWQAPVATSRSKGDLAIVGYFIRKDGNASKLCRLFVNPDDPDYAVYTAPEAWVNDALLDAKAPADETSNLQGVFLENVPGMWITTYSDAVTAYPAAYDSRVIQKFPARIEISLALLDKVGAQRVASGQAVLPDSRNCADLASYLNQLPANIAEHVQTATINVPFPF